MTYRQTFVIEYEKSADAPGFGEEGLLGGKLYAVQFADALHEIDLLRERATEKALEEVDAILYAEWKEQANGK